MDLEQFVKDAVRTESIIDEVKTNRAMFMNIAKVFMLSGQMLDLYKKNIFYKRPVKCDVLVDNFREITEAMTTISQQFKSASYLENDDVIDTNPRLFHSIVGVATEAVELVEQLHKSIENDEQIDVVNLLEESFDSNWYFATMHDELDASMENTLNRGIEKLRKRYPEKFTNDAANNRKLDEEREILNKMVKE